MAFTRHTTFVSPAPIYSRILEEFKSYFNTGALDQLMFEPWTLDTLREFKSTYLPIEQCVINLANYRGELPCDFKLVREVWACGVHKGGTMKSPFTFYYQTDCRIAPTWNSTCDSCPNEPLCGYEPQQPVNLPSICDLHPMSSNNCMCASGDQFRVTHKVQTNIGFEFTVEGMLSPNNYRTINRCWEHSPNKQVSSIDKFDIVGHEIVTSFREGTIFMLYYAEPLMGEDDNYEIPDEERFQKYLYYYLQFMIYQQLFIQSTEETFNMLLKKRDDAEQRMLNERERARQDAMAQDIYSVRASIIRSYNRNNRFKLR